VSAAILAVVGTLLGVLVTGSLQNRAAAAERRAAHTAEQRAAVAALAAALADHRRAMWLREDARLSGAPAADVAELRATSHATRSAVTAPEAAAVMLAPQLRPAVTAAVKATYALRGAPDADTLAARRAAAVSAADDMLTAAAGALGGAR